MVWDSRACKSRLQVATAQLPLALVMPLFALALNSPLQPTAAVPLMLPAAGPLRHVIAVGVMAAGTMPPALPSVTPAIIVPLAAPQMLLRPL